MVASTFGGQFTDYFSEKKGRKNWRATVTLTFADNLGAAVANAAVEVLISPEGKSSEKFSGTTDGNGEVTIVSNKYKRSGGSKVDWIDFELTDASVPKLTWDQQQPTLRVDVP